MLSAALTLLIHVYCSCSHSSRPSLASTSSPDHLHSYSCFSFLSLSSVVSKALFFLDCARRSTAHCMCLLRLAACYFQSAVCAYVHQKKHKTASGTITTCKQLEGKKRVNVTCRALIVISVCSLVENYKPLLVSYHSLIHQVDTLSSCNEACVCCEELNCLSVPLLWFVCSITL